MLLDSFVSWLQQLIQKFDRDVRPSLDEGTLSDKYRGQYLAEMVKNKKIPVQIVDQLFSEEISNPFNINNLIDPILFIELFKSYFNWTEISEIWWSKVNKAKLIEVYLEYISVLLLEYADYFQWNLPFKDLMDWLMYSDNRWNKIFSRYYSIISLIPKSNKIVTDRSWSRIFWLFKGGKN